MHVLATVVLAAVAGIAPTKERPHGTYVVVPVTSKTPRLGPGPVHRILYMNRNGGTYYSGDDNSSEHSSSIPWGTSELTAFALGDSAWDEVMTCVRDMYAPFDIEVTDIDPGATPHIESAVGGYPGEVGMGNGVGGVAPMNEDCSVVERAVVFTFAGVYGDDTQGICETVAQESAHALGLDHEYLCEDPMTYLYGCGKKTFHDEDVSCGEYGPRTCMCGGSTQNSVQAMLAVLGPAIVDDEPPIVGITTPTEGQVVDPGFPVEATATDGKGVTRVELWLDGASYAEDTDAPYSFTTPNALGDGAHTVEVRAYDAAGNMAPVSVHVSIGAPPQPPGGDPGTPGGTGSPCETDDMCTTGICLAGASGGFCSESCDMTGADNCPDGYSCSPLPAGGGLCVPDPGTGGSGGDDSGGCAVGGRSGAGGLLALFLLVGLVVRRRKR